MLPYAEMIKHSDEIGSFFDRGIDYSGIYFYKLGCGAENVESAVLACLRESPDKGRACPANCL